MSVAEKLRVSTSPGEFAKDFLTTGCILARVVCNHYAQVGGKETQASILRKVVDDKLLRPCGIASAEVRVSGTSEEESTQSGVDTKGEKFSIAEVSNGFVGQLKDMMSVFKDVQNDETEKPKMSMNLDMIHSGVKGLEPGILNTDIARRGFIPGWSSYATANSLAKILSRVCTWDEQRLQDMLGNVNVKDGVPGASHPKQDGPEKWGLGVQLFGGGVAGYEAFGGSTAYFSPGQRFSVRFSFLPSQQHLLHRYDVSSCVIVCLKVSVSLYVLLPNPACPSLHREGCHSRQQPDYRSSGCESDRTHYFFRAKNPTAFFFGRGQHVSVRRT